MHGSDKRLVRLFERIARQDPERLAPLYSRHRLDPARSPDTLVREIRLDGSNSWASILRGFEGVSYDQVVAGVARQLKLASAGVDDEVVQERAVLEAVLGRFFETVPDEQREILLHEVGETQLARPLRESRWVPGSLEIMARDVGAPELALLLQQVVLRGVGYGLARVAAKRAVGVTGLAVPLLNVAMLGWTAWDLAGPAFRKTVPTVVEIALLRLAFGVDQLTAAPR